MHKQKYVYVINICIRIHLLITVVPIEVKISNETLTDCEAGVETDVELDLAQFKPKNVKIREAMILTAFIEDYSESGTGLPSLRGSAQDRDTMCDLLCDYFGYNSNGMLLLNETTAFGKLKGTTPGIVTLSIWQKLCIFAQKRMFTCNTGIDALLVLMTAHVKRIGVNYGIVLSDGHVLKMTDLRDSIDGRDCFPLLKIPKIVIVCSVFSSENDRNDAMSSRGGPTKVNSAGNFIFVWVSAYELITNGSLFFQRFADVMRRVETSQVKFDHVLSIVTKYLKSTSVDIHSTYSHQLYFIRRSLIPPAFTLTILRRNDNSIIELNHVFAHHTISNVIGRMCGELKEFADFVTSQITLTRDDTVMSCEDELSEYGVLSSDDVVSVEVIREEKENKCICVFIFLILKCVYIL